MSHRFRLRDFWPIPALTAWLLAASGVLWLMGDRRPALASTDCRVTTSSGDTRTAPGSSEVFLMMFILTIVVIAALISGAAVAARASAILATGAAAFLVIFVL